MCFLADLCDLLGERDFFGVRLLLRERDLDRDCTFRHRPGLRERERERGKCNLKKKINFILKKIYIYNFKLLYHIT